MHHMNYARFRTLSLLLAPLASLIFLGQGCLGSPTKLDGGLFITKDSGVNWIQLKTLNLGTRLGSVADLGTVTMTIDPQDPLAVYVGTTENGLLTSLDGGDSWAPSKGLSIGRINALMIDPKDKCTIYAARANQIFKTTNCQRDWNQVFFDPRVDKSFTALAIDWFNPNIIYAGTSEGDLYRSDNKGAAWKVVHRVEAIKINNMVVDPRDSRTLYVATNGAGVLKTSDGGTTWQNIVEPFRDLENARRPSAIIVDPNVKGRVYTISKYGVIKSEDGGNSWKPLTLPTPPGTIAIKALVIHPKNSQTLVYATDTSIVFSTNGGGTWSAKKLPTVRGVAALLFRGGSDPALYLGAAPKAK